VPDLASRVVLYVRVSAVMGRAGDDFLSPDVQVSAMRQRVAGMREVGVVDDIDVTGRTFSRRGLDTVRAMVEAGDVDAIAVYDVSRLGRNVLESLRFLAWLDEHQVVVVSACEQVDTTTPAGKLMLTNMLAIAEYRSGEIGRGWAHTIASRARSGRHHGRATGYRRAGGQPLVLDLVAAPAVAAAFVSYARGVPMRQIARDVADQLGRPVSIGNVKKWFRNPVYLGHVHLFGVVVAPDAHPGLVDQATWDDVQSRLARDTVTPPRHLDPTWALVGLSFCPGGHRLRKESTVYRGQRVNRLTCGMGSRRDPLGTCKGVGNPRLAEVEGEVLVQVRAYLHLLRTDDVARAAQIARRARAGAGRAELERELGRVRAAMARLAKGWALGEVPDAGYHQPMAELGAAEKELARQVAASRPLRVEQTPAEAAGAVASLLEVWPGATVAERNRLLRAVVARIVVARPTRYREPCSGRVEVSFR
jgi:DNA invertase Pin-like site-specific DNA recombinase